MKDGERQKGIKKMESRIQNAINKKRCGMNCAQAVACTYCDVSGIPEETMAAIMQGFGTGIGATMEGTCGALAGACAVVGMLDKDKGRAEAVRDAKYIMKQFMERNKTVTCKALKGIETGQALRGCEDCVADAAEFLEDVISQKEL